MNKPFSRELVINATTFKAKSLKLLDELHAGKLDKIIVTKRGKPVAVVQGATERRPRFADMWGCMKGTLTIVDPHDDLMSSFDPDWEETIIRDWDEQNQ